MAERIGQTRYALDFERPLIVLEDRIDELKRLGVPQLSQEVQLLEERALRLRHEIFANLTPWQKVQLSRHPQRPLTQDYIDRIFTGFIELHGDRAFQDDAAVVGGLAWLGEGEQRQAVLVLGHQKGRGTKENVRRNFGMPRPEGYRKGLRLMNTAARLRLPIITFIDTPGAYPGIDAEERGQAEAIAKNLEVMARLPVPILTVVIGEGGSGGALALGVADRLLMLEYAVYSVISPEGCASILWKDQSKVETAAREMRMTADQIRALGIADEVIAEPTGGAHRGRDQVDKTAAAVKEALLRHLGELLALQRGKPGEAKEDRHRATATDALLAGRYAKYRAMGAFVVE